MSMLPPMIAHGQFLLDKLMAHQTKCGSLEEPEDKGVIKCSRCGLMVLKGDVPTIEGKGFTIEYH